MQFTIEFQADHLKQMLEVVRREIASPQEMLGSIGESLLRVNQERHAKGVDPDGKAWAELAESTKAAGKRKGGPLNRTGRMLANFHYQVAADALRLGFDDGDGFPAKYHQDGSRGRSHRNKMVEGFGAISMRSNHPGLPARPLVGFPETDQQLVTDVTAGHLALVLNSVR